jgi:hypothetical protein
MTNKESSSEKIGNLSKVEIFLFYTILFESLKNK